MFTFLSIKKGIQQLQAGNYDTTVNINADDEFEEMGGHLIQW